LYSSAHPAEVRTENLNPIPGPDVGQLVGKQPRSGLRQIDDMTVIVLAAEANLRGDPATMSRYSPLVFAHGCPTKIRRCNHYAIFLSKTFRFSTTTRSANSANIARVLDIDVEELKASYEKELAGGHIKPMPGLQRASAARRSAKGRESVTAAIFWLKTRARWKEVSVHEHVEAHEEITISQTQEFIRRSLEGADRFNTKIINMAARSTPADGDQR
jgi:hypothetical protein